MSRPSYRDHATAWRRYQPHLPADVRLTGDSLPAEAWWSWRGHDVHLDRFAAPGATTTVVVLHGGGGYGRMLAGFGRAIHERTGAEVVLPDLPGYGLTAVPAGTAPRYEDWISCAAALAETERAAGRRVVLLGMSMGGMLGVHAAAAAPAGTVAAVGATCLLDPEVPRVRRGVGRVPAPAWAIRATAADRLRIPVRWVAPLGRMSSVPAINRLCARDPQGGGGRVAVGFLRSWMAHRPPTAPEAFARCPVLLLHPLADRWTPPAWSQAALARFAAPTRSVGLPGCEHWPLEDPGRGVLLDEVAQLVAGAAWAGAALA